MSSLTGQQAARREYPHHRVLSGRGSVETVLTSPGNEFQGFCWRVRRLGKRRRAGLISGVHPVPRVLLPAQGFSPWAGLQPVPPRVGSLFTDHDPAAGLVGMNHQAAVRLTAPQPCPRGPHHAPTPATRTRAARATLAYGEHLDSGAQEVFLQDRDASLEPPEVVDSAVPQTAGVMVAPDVLGVSHADDPHPLTRQPLHDVSRNRPSGVLETRPAPLMQRPSPRRSCWAAPQVHLRPPAIPGRIELCTDRSVHLLAEQAAAITPGPTRWRSIGLSAGPRPAFPRPTGEPGAPRRPPWRVYAAGAPLLEAKGGSASPESRADPRPHPLLGGLARASAAWRWTRSTALESSTPRRLTASGSRARETTNSLRGGRPKPGPGSRPVEVCMTGRWERSR
jgi:hypothetical protein